MGFFSKKVFKNNNEKTSEQEAQKRVNEDGSEWIQKAYETSKSFNDEDMGGERPRTSAYNSELLQSESLAEVPCPVSSKVGLFLGRLNSHISKDAYKLKVEELKTDVLGRAGGGQDAPKRARIYIAAEDNEGNTFLTASIVATNKSLLLNSLVKAAQQDEFAETLILAAAAKIRALKRIEEDEKLPKELKDILKTLMENL